MRCDVCTRPEAGTIVPAKQFSDAVRRGFNPFVNGCLPDAVAKMGGPNYPELWARSAMSGQTSESDWNVCAACMSKLLPFLSAMPVSEPLQISDLMTKAKCFCERVFAAASANRIDTVAMADLYEAIKWLDRLCNLDKVHGEPAGMRGNMYLILAQVEKRAIYLDRAHEDFTTAIRIGMRDAESIAEIRRNLRTVEKLRTLI